MAFDFPSSPSVGKMYFDTPIIDFYKAIGFLSGSLILVAFIMLAL